ncbi:unnamed protein product [Rhodiola kirilowii]
MVLSPRNRHLFLRTTSVLTLTLLIGALGKQKGTEKPKGPLEALRPKLQPTQQQTRYRKSAYAPGGGSRDSEVAGVKAVVFQKTDWAFSESQP